MYGSHAKPFEHGLDHVRLHWLEHGIHAMRGDADLVRRDSVVSDEILFGGVRDRDHPSRGPRAPPRRDFEQPPGPVRVSVRKMKIPKIVDGDDGARVKRRHDMGGHKRGHPVDAPACGREAARASKIAETASARRSPGSAVHAASMKR